VTHNPIAISVGADLLQSYGGGVLDCSTAGELNHAVVVYGYGSAVVNDANVSVWLAKNSWGDTWGEGGYFRVRKDCGGGGALAMYNQTRLALVPIRGSNFSALWPGEEGACMPVAATCACYMDTRAVRCRRVWRRLTSCVPRSWRQYERRISCASILQ
jgi:hypothetical protein